MEVSLIGGTGRATVLSPTKVFKNEKGILTAKIEWSSPFYDYMIVDGEKYLPVNKTGNSVFEIPIKSENDKINVIADTVAMSTPHEIEYTLEFSAK